MSRDIPSECHGCAYLHTGGIKDGKHDRWCWHFGKPTYEAIGRCRLTEGRKPKASEESNKT